MGIIAQRALVWWKKFPAQTRNYYDVEDLIADLVLHVVKRTPSYNPKRAQESTWVFRVAENRCKEILAHYYTQQYTACAEASLDDIECSRAGERRRAVQDLLPPVEVDSKQLSEAQNAVECMIKSGSDTVRDLLEQIFSSGVRCAPSPNALMELKNEARRHSVRLRDFEIVYRYATV